MATKSIEMRWLLLLGVIMVSLSARTDDGAEKPGDKPPNKPNNLTADVYEKEDASVSFSAHVNLIRETDVIEVFLTGKTKVPFY